LHPALLRNAIARQLVEVSGAELTTATGTCGSCGASGVVAVSLVAEAVGARFDREVELGRPVLEDLRGIDVAVDPLNAPVLPLEVDGFKAANVLQKIVPLAFQEPERHRVGR
jgi:hypothetical protein